MNGTVKDAIAVAARNVGFIEGPNNKNPYAPLVGLPNNQAWCAAFICAVMLRAGVKLPTVSAYTPTLANAFKAQGRLHREPKVGAVMFLYFPSKGRIAHCGLVTEVGDGWVICIEGNTDSAGGRTGGRVMRHRRSLSNLSFGYPEYKLAAVGEHSPVLQLGDKGTKVSDVQRALKKAGLYTGAVTGQFNDGTDKAMRILQRTIDVEDDGVVGPVGWAVLRTISRVCR